MSGFRFSIATLLFLIAIVGAALAALRAQSPLLAGLLTLAMLGVILAAIVGAICFAGESRYFCLGFALFGGSYFAIVFTPIAPAAKAEIEQPLVEFQYTFWSSELPPNAHPQIPGITWRDDPITKQRIALPRWDYAFGTTLHCVVNLLFAFGGGMIGQWLYLQSVARRKVQ
jgi:hypothetical protein